MAWSVIFSRSYRARRFGPGVCYGCWSPMLRILGNEPDSSCVVRVLFFVSFFSVRWAAVDVSTLDLFRGRGNLSPTQNYCDSRFHRTRSSFESWMYLIFVPYMLRTT